MKAASGEGPVTHLVPALFDSADGVVGGAERYVLELARHMAGVVPTRLVTFGERDREEQIGELRVRVIGGAWFVRGERSNPFAPALLRELPRAAVVHCHQQHVVMSSVAAVVARLSGSRVVCTDLGGGGWDISGYVSTDRWFHRHLHISEYSRKVAGHCDAPWAEVVYGGVDTEKFSPDPSTPRDGTILFVGRVLPHKGINDLIDAVDPGVRVEIIGPAPDRRYLADLERRASGKQILFRFGCDDAALVNAYRRATCVVLPSVYRDMYGHETTVPELLGQTLLEGMACGAPGICTDVASLPEIVQDGVSGLVVPPNDPGALGRAIRRFSGNRARAAEMGARAREHVLARFTWDAVTARCLRAYSRLALRES